MFFQTIDILGTIAFAISGVLVAMNKRMDPFGVLIIAFVTAVGGGTLRDIMVGVEPVSWMRNMTFVYVIIGSAIFAVIFRNYLKHLRRSLFLFDTVHCNWNRNRFGSRIASNNLCCARYNDSVLWWCNQRYFVQRNSCDF